MPHALDGLVLASSLAEVVGALFVAAVAAGCLRQYARPHLSAWAWSWLAGAATITIGVGTALLRPLPFGAAAAAGTAALVLRYVQVAAFLVGARALRPHDGRPDDRRAPLLAAAVALGLVSGLLSAWRGPWRAGLGLLPISVQGLAFAWGGLAFWRAAARPAGEGRRLVGGSLILYGAARLHEVAVAVSARFGGPVPAYALLLGFVDFIVLAALGVGLVLALLEDEAEKLRASEEKFERVFRVSPDGLAVSASQTDGGQFIDVNDSLARMLGYEPHEMIGRTTGDLGVWLQPEGLDRVLRLLREHGRVEGLEVAARTRSGEERLCLLWCEIVEVARRRYVITLTRDITEEHRREQRIRDSEERLRLALEASGLGTWEWDIGKGAMTWAGAVEGLLGLPAGGSPGTLQAFLDTVHADDRPRVEKAIAAVADGATHDYHAEFRVAASSETRWLEGRGRAYVNAEGRPVLMRGTVQDVTARKQAEQTRRESEERWRRLSEATFEGIALSQDGVIVDINQRLAEMLGYTPGELIGKPVLDCVALEDRARVLEAIRSAHTGTYQHRSRRKDGSTFPVESRARVLGHGDTNLRVTAVRDVSEWLRMEAELRRRETLAAMGSLVARVAHEVRTPLFSLSATVEALEAGAGTADEQQELRDLLRSQVRRLSALMRDLLDYGRPPELKLARAGIGDIVQRAARACGGQASQSSVRVVLDVPDGLPRLQADAGRLEQVFQNLLANAVQHSPRGSTVRVSAQPSPAPLRGLVCAVEDEGPGLQPADLQRVFEPFFSRRSGGTGMGLAIAQRFVEAHGGSLTAGNRAGGGAVFTVFLPEAAEERAGARLA